MKKYEKSIITLIVAIVYFIVIFGVFFIGFNYEMQKALVEAGKSAVIVGLVVWFLDYLSSSNKKNKKK